MFTLYNLYINRFLGDFIPIVPLIGVFLLANDFSLSDASLFFLCLSVTVIIFEVPSGMLADRIDTRHVLVISRIAKLLAFVSLLFAHTLPLLCLSGVLWGIASAFDSGALQSYTYRLVRDLGFEHTFDTIYSRLFTASLVGLLIAGLVATQIDYLGFVTLHYIGIAALFLCVMSTVLLPKVSHGVTKNTDTDAASTSRISALFHLHKLLLILLAIGIFSGGIKGSLDEYTGILLENKGLSYSMVGYALFVLELIKTTGASVADRIRLTTTISQTYTLCILGIAFITISYGNIAVTGIALIIVLLIDAILWVHNDSLIQKKLTDKNRATVASVKNFGTEILAAGVFLTCWLFSSYINTESLYLYGGALLILVSVILFTLHRSTQREP